MMRDVELMRRILFDIEDAPGPLEVVSIGDTVSAALVRNLDLLAEAGYVQSSTASSTMRVARRQVLLTWRGHELLNAIRSDADWAILNERLPIASGQVPFQVIEQYAFHMAAQKGLPMSP